MRLLIYMPTHGKGPRADCLESARGQQTDHDVVFELSWHNPFKGTRDLRNVTAQYERAREMALGGGFDALLTVEHDMLIPPQAAQVMADTDAPVVYAPYMLRHGSNVLSLWQWTGGRNLGMSLSLYPRELAHWRKVGVGPVCGVGFGCTLIRRDVLEALPFRGPDAQAPDLPFAMDCIRAGYKPAGRFDLECGHYHEGTVLWPWRMAEGRMIGRVLAVAAVTVQDNGTEVKLRPGRYYSLSAEVRDNLVRAGYAQQVDTEPEWTEPDLPMPEDTSEALIAKRQPPKRKRSRKRASRAVSGGADAVLQAAAQSEA